MPFNEKEKASIVYQLINTDTSGRLSAAELQNRTCITERACQKYKNQCPKIIQAYSYVKEKDGIKIAKACAFIEKKEFLAGFDPSKDQFRKIFYSDYYLRDYVEKGDLDSVRFILRYSKGQGSVSNHFEALKMAAARRHYEIMQLLLQQSTINDMRVEALDDMLLDALPQTLDTEEAKKFTILLISASKNKDAILAHSYCLASRQSLEQVNFVLGLVALGLGSISQESHFDALNKARDLKIVALITFLHRQPASTW